MLTLKFHEYFIGFFNLEISFHTEMHLKISNFQSGFDNGYRNRRKQTLVLICSLKPLLQNPYASKQLRQLVFLSRVKNTAASGRFIAIFSIFLLSFLGGWFKFTADGLKKLERVFIGPLKWPTWLMAKMPQVPSSMQKEVR